MGHGNNILLAFYILNPIYKSKHSPKKGEIRNGPILLWTAKNVKSLRRSHVQLCSTMPDHALTAIFYIHSISPPAIISSRDCHPDQFAFFSRSARSGNISDYDHEVFINILKRRLLPRHHIYLWNFLCPRMKFNSLLQTTIVPPSVLLVVWSHASATQPDS